MEQNYEDRSLRSSTSGRWKYSNRATGRIEFYDHEQRRDDLRLIRPPEAQQYKAKKHKDDDDG